MPEAWQIEYNERQFGHMLAALDAYDRDEMSSDALASTIEFLLSVLEVVDEETRNTFRRPLGALDELAAARSGATTFRLEPEAEAGLTRRAVNDLRLSIRNHVAEHHPELLA